MNTMQHESLFTDLSPEQAETITAAAGGANAFASYGSAAVGFIRTGRGSFDASMSVGDRKKDGYPVYARLQARATDGTIFTSNRRFNRRGSGTKEIYSLDGSSSKTLSHMRVAIYRQNPGRDLVKVGSWERL